MNNKKPGKIITYIDNDGYTQFGRTYNCESTVNGKVVVHLLDRFLNHIVNNKGDIKVLVEAKKITIQGFID